MNLTHPDFPSGVILATYGAMSNTDNEHGTHTAGSVVGRGLAGLSPVNTSGCGDQTAPLSTVRGMAWGAQLVTNNLFDGGYTTETDMIRWSYTQGARLNTNSWSYGGNYTYSSASVAVDGLVRDASTLSGNQELTILFSAGNYGTANGGSSNVTTPGTAKNIITVGASQNDRCGSYVPSQQTGPDIDTVTAFSSRGPSQSRVKPDVVAVGADVLSVDSLNCVGADCENDGWDESWTGMYYRLMPGTSMSCPITAGATAVFYEFYNDIYGSMPSPALAKAAMINGAVDIRGAGFPDYIQGWGRINLRNSIEGPTGGQIEFIDQDAVTPLSTGGSWSTNFSVYSSDVRLKITLVWTDPPSTANDTTPLVNNLNLVVTAPNGTVYRGNRFTGAWSTPNPGTTTDTANNVENVFVQNPVTGTWTIQVLSANTGQNPPGLTGQDFAIAYSGRICGATPPGNVTAQAEGNNAIRVSWDTVSGANEYHVFHTSTSGSGYTLVGTVSAPTTNFLDTNLSGKVTYYYLVRSVTNCTSLVSSETSAIAEGDCDFPPSFAGLKTVSSPIETGCALDLSWDAASAPCGGIITYSIYRSTVSGFMPALSNRIAAGISATSYQDASGLAQDTTYYYIVRSTDESNGIEDSNTIRQSGTACGPLINQTKYSENFDSINAGEDAGWSMGYFSGNADDWRGVQVCDAYSGTKIFRYGGAGCDTNYSRNRTTVTHSLAIPQAITFHESAQNGRLAFRHRYNFSTGDGCYLRISLDGSTFTRVTSVALLSGDYNGTINGWGMWTGSQTGFSLVSVDLDAACNLISGNTGGCAGKTVYLGFTTYVDTDRNVNLGWFLDDVVVTADEPGPCTGTPQDVVYFTATATSGKTKLEWVNPPSDYSSTIIRYSSTAYPTSPADGSPVTTRTGVAGAYDSYEHTTEV